MRRGKRRAAAREDLAAHVDRDVAGARVACGPGAEQVARLRRAARAQLDERRCGNEPADVASVVREERRLGTRLVVLRLLADALEQLAADRIVEIAAVEPPRMVREATDH